MEAWPPRHAPTRSPQRGLWARIRDGSVDPIGIALRLLGLSVLFVLAGLVVKLGLLMDAVGRGDVAAALRIDGWSPVANGRAAEAEFDAGNLAVAEEDAREALAQTPLYPRALRAFGFARELQGDRPGAAQAIYLSSLLGWRDIPTQSWLMLDAADAEDWRAATVRADAIARQGFHEMVFPTLAALLRTRDGRAALADQLSAGQRWRAAFIVYLSTLPDEQLPLADAFLVQLAARSTSLQAGEIGAYVDRLFRSNEYPRAARIWRAARIAGTKAGSVAVQDGTFTAAGERRRAYTSPFEWSFSNAVSAGAWVERAADTGRGFVLAVQSGGLSSERVAWQAMTLAPGNYRLAVLVNTNGPSTLGVPAEWRVICLPGGRVLASLPAPRRSVAWSRTSTVLRVAPDCTAQQLQLRTLAAPVQLPVNLWFDDIAIVRHDRPEHR